MRRGRTPSNSDAAALTAVANAKEFLQKNAISATAFAAQVKASPSSVLRAINADPPAWTPTLRKIDNFIKSEAAAPMGLPAELGEQLRVLRGDGSASATAAVLRAVADLLELRATRQGGQA